MTSANLLMRSSFNVGTALWSSFFLLYLMSRRQAFGLPTHQPAELQLNQASTSKIQCRLQTNNRLLSPTTARCAIFFESPHHFNNLPHLCKNGRRPRDVIVPFVAKPLSSLATRSNVILATQRRYSASWHQHWEEATVRRHREHHGTMENLRHYKINCVFPNKTIIWRPTTSTPIESYTITIYTTSHLFIMRVFTC